MNQFVFFLNQFKAKALIVAGICHDLDHRGFTNNFCTLSNHIIAQLYDESPLENHHIYVTMKILEVSILNFG